MESKHLALAAKNTLITMNHYLLKKIGFTKLVEKNLKFLVLVPYIMMCLELETKKKRSKNTTKKNRTYIIRKRYEGNEVIRQWYDVFGERWINE